MIYPKHSSQIVNRCSLFLNHSWKNIEQGLTSEDVRSIWNNPFPYIAHKVI